MFRIQKGGSLISSVSFEKDVAKYFAGGRESGLILILRAPKGSKGIFLNNVSIHKEEKKCCSSADHF